MPLYDTADYAFLHDLTPGGGHAFSPGKALAGVASVGVSQAGPRLAETFGHWLNITGAAGVAGWITAVGGAMLGLKWLYDSRRTTIFEKRWSIVRESNHKELKEALAREAIKDAQIKLLGDQTSSLLTVNGDLTRYVRELTIAAIHVDPAAVADRAMREVAAGSAGSTAVTVTTVERTVTSPPAALPTADHDARAAR